MARHLIDSIMRQTTVLIAQLSTASGIRSPLSHVADQVFLSLSEEIESQGVSRKVVADMFGLALRGYQRKVARLGTTTQPSRTLWQAVLEYLESQGPVTRVKLLSRFGNQEDGAVLAVTADLVNGGLLYRAGQGDATVFGAMPEASRRRFAEEEELNALSGLVWLAAFRNPRSTEAELRKRVAAGESFDEALATLVGGGRVRRVTTPAGDVLEAEPFIVEVGSSEGWQAAVFDHFQAVTTAIAAKLRLKNARSAVSDDVGGTTLHFGIHDEHPLRAEVLGSLARTRKTMEDLWAKVTEHNTRNPVPEEERTVVTFYFGQTVRRPDDADDELHAGKSDEEGRS